MQRSVVRRLTPSSCLPLILWLLAFSLLTLALTPGLLTAQAKDQRVVFGSAGFTESNRFWTIARPEHLQYDPFWETLLDLDPKTGEYTPRLAEKWEASADLKEGTFYLRKGVQFHYGFGEFTAKDVLHSHTLITRQDSTAGSAPIWRDAEVQVVNDHLIVFRMKRPLSIVPYLASRASELRIVSKAQWDKEGLEGFEKQPAGTGSYRYVGRQTGVSVEYTRVEKHWSGQLPDFKDLEIRLVPEETTRLAMLMSGEAHIVDLSRELQKEAAGKGMKVISSAQPVDWMSIYFGGQYYIPGDPKFQAGSLLANKKVRQALNMSVNRQEILGTIFAGKGTLAYVSGWLPISEGWNPEWEKKV